MNCFNDVKQVVGVYGPSHIYRGYFFIPGSSKRLKFLPFHPKKSIWWYRRSRYTIGGGFEDVFFMFTPLKLGHKWSDKHLRPDKKKQINWWLESITSIFWIFLTIGWTHWIKPFHGQNSPPQKRLVFTTPTGTETWWPPSGFLTDLLNGEQASFHASHRKSRRIFRSKKGCRMSCILDLFWRRVHYGYNIFRANLMDWEH